MLYFLAYIITTLLSIVSFIVIASVVLNLLIHFELLNRYKHRFVYKLEDMLNRLTGPMYAYVRRYIPPFNGIDFSPLVILLGIQFIEKGIYIALAS